MSSRTSVGKPTKGRVRYVHPSRPAIVIPFALSLFVAFIVHPGPTLAQRKAVLWIQVVDINTGKPVEGAEVTFKGTMIRMTTDKDGEIGIELSGTKYGVTIRKAGYYESVFPKVVLEPGKATRIKCEMVPGNPDEQIFFGIGGINIIGKKELLPEQLATTHEISSAEIEHNLSTNLGDVLTLVPGVERTDPPGLSKKSQVEFRGTGFIGGTEGTAAIFGTKVILDDIPISNNANLQAGTGTHYGPTTTTAGSGIDLRTIPADNIEKVEVVTGVPSAEYGDLTSGLVKVITKKEKQPHRLKIKSNPDTKEANLSGGWMPHGTGISYNLNYAYSERDIRLDDDNYSRINGQFYLRNNFAGNKVSLMNKFYFTGVVDETNLDPNDPLSIEQYNRDKTYVYGFTCDFDQSEHTSYFLTGSVNYTKRDSYLQKVTGADTRVLTDATETGTREGYFEAGAYIFKVWTKGEEWNANVRGNFRRSFDFLGQGHALLLGGEYTFDNNVGQGRIFDPLHPPYGTPGQRPLPFDASPALHQASVYLEDEISGILFKTPWIANLGIRYEMYRPEGINFGGLLGEGAFVESKNGSFSNPRLRLRIDFTESTRVRLGWGRSSKMPPMTTIYRGPEYIDVVEENISPPDSAPLVSTYVFDYDNPYLKGYQNDKGEISLDKRIGSVATVLTGFFSKSEGVPRSVLTPLVLYRYRWTGWPDPASRTPIDTLITDISDHYRNVGWSRNYGVEFQLSTRRISALSTLFRISASYVRAHRGAEGTYTSSARSVASLGGRTVYPFYHYEEAWSQKMIVNWIADWFFKPVGLWTTFYVQQTLFDSDVNKDDPILYSTGYYDPLADETVYLTPAQSAALGLDRNVDPLDLVVFKKPNDRFLFNINVTKSLGRGAELSMFVHNFFDDAAFYVDQAGFYRARNHDIFYGVEFSMVLNQLFRTTR
jgi:hypothetical protein